MARENQGLQITLIVFIMLTLICGGLAFFFNKQLTKTNAELEGAKASATEAGQRATTFQAERDELAVMITGAAPSSDGIDPIKTVYDRIMDGYTAVAGEPAVLVDAYALALPQGQDNYNGLVTALYTSNISLRKSNTTLTQQYAAMEVQMNNTAAEREAQRAEYQMELARETAAKDSAEARLDSTEQTLTDEREAFLVSLTTERQTVQTVELDRDTRVAQANDERDETARANQTIQDILNDYRSETMETPDGEITHVSQRDNIVFVNLGSDHGIRRQMTFSVYSDDTNNVTAEYAKATIEIMEVIDRDLSKARILTDEGRDPIMPQDLIYTPLWRPYQHLSFALTGGLDIDEDGESDLDLIRRLIGINGGVVDAYIDDEGEINGDITAETRFLVLGTRTTELSTDKQRDARTQFINEADRLGVESLQLADLLRLMGYRETAPAVGFGEFSSPGDFRPRPEGGIQRDSPGRTSDLFMGGEGEFPDSPGTVSGLFRERTPPSHATGTAYE